MSETKREYKNLLYQQKRRNDRNVRLLAKLENIEKKAAFLQAKTDRIKSLKSIYKNQFGKYDVEYKYPKQFSNRSIPRLRTSERNYSSNYEYYEIPPKYSYYEDNIANKYSEPVCVIKDITLEDAIEEISKRFILIPKTKTTISDFSEKQNAIVDHFDKKAQYRYDIDSKNYEEFNYSKESQDNKTSEDSDNDCPLNENKNNFENSSHSEKHPLSTNNSKNKDNSDDAIIKAKNEVLEKENSESKSFKAIEKIFEEMKLDVKNKIHETEKNTMPIEQTDLNLFNLKTNLNLEKQKITENSHLNVEQEQPIPQNNIQYETNNKISPMDKDNHQYNQNEQNCPQKLYNTNDESENVQEIAKDEIETNYYTNENGININNQEYEHVEEQNKDYSYPQQAIEAENYIQQDQNYDAGIYTQENIIANPDEQTYDQTEYEHREEQIADQPIAQDLSNTYYNQEEQHNIPNYYGQENQNYPVEAGVTEQESVDPNYYSQNVTEGDQSQYYYDQSQENNYYNQEGAVSAENETQNLTYQENENYNINTSNVQYEGEYVQPYNSQAQYIENPEQYIENPEQYVENPIQYAENPIQYAENPEQYVENPVQYTENPEYVENPEQYIENPEQYTENPEQYVENPQQYVENVDQQSNPQYYDENTTADNLSASQIENTDIQPLKILDSDIEYENSVRDDQSKQESDFDFSLSQQQ